MSDKSPVVPPLQMGDMEIKDVGDLGVDFFNRMSRDKHGEMEKLTFINDLGADALAQWLVDRAINRRQRAKYSFVQRTLQQEMRQAAASVQRQAGFGERFFTPVGQTLGFINKNEHVEKTERDFLGSVDLKNPGGESPDWGLPKVEDDLILESESGEAKFRDPNAVFGSGPTPLSVERHEKFYSQFRDDPIGVVGRSELGLKGDHIATDLPGSMKAKMDLGIKDEWDNGDYSDDLDLNNFDFADPATDSPFR